MSRPVLNPYALATAERRSPSTIARVITALCVAAFGAAFTLAERIRVPEAHSDFGAVWFGARSIVRGVDPYPLVGPGLPFSWWWHLNYPGTALIAAIPF